MPYLRRFLSSLLLLNLMVFCLTGFALYRSYQQYQADAIQTNANLSRVLDENLSRLVEKIDFTLLAVIDEIDREERHGGLDRQTLEKILANFDSRLPESLGLRVTNSEGIIDYAVSNVVNSNAQASDREYFLRLKASRDVGLYISEPINGRIYPSPIVVFARRRIDHDGTFAGIVLVSITVDALSKAFSTIDLGPQGNIALWSAAPALLVRYSAVQGLPLQAVKPSARLLGLITADAPPTAFHGPSGTDGLYRQFYFRKVSRWPLYLILGTADQDYLYPWWREAAYFIGLGGLFVLASFYAFSKIHSAMNKAEQSQVEAQEAHRRSDLILHSAGQGICGINSQGRIVFINRAAKQLLGLPYEVGPGLKFHDLVHPDHSSENCLLQAALDGSSDAMSRTFDGETYRRSDGSVFSVEVTLTPMQDEHGNTGVVNVFNDITERKDTERRLLATNAELERFAYIAAHDLREPVRLVSNYLTLIEKSLGDELSEVTRKYIRFAVTGAKRMDQMIRDLLDYSRIGKTEGKFQKISLNDVVKQSLVELSMTIAESATQVVVAEGLPEVCGVDSELTRLFQNLIGNAIKYRHAERKPEIEIGSREEGADWIIWVRDNGMGISPEYREQVFAVFHRLVPKDLYDGTGIGLAVCRRIVEHHGGRIWIEDAADGGCVFLMAFPRAAVA